MPTRTDDAPRLPAGLRPPSLWVELWSLFCIEMTSWRWSWRSMLITGALAPTVSILGFGVFARDSGPTSLAYVLTGNLVLSLMFGNMGNIESHITFMRLQGSLDYFATLPIHRAMLLLAMVVSFFLISAPALLSTLLLGVLILGVQIHPTIYLLMIIPLCILPLSGLGALIGVTARSPEVANSINLIVTLALTGLGPVIIPPDRLPAWLNGLGWLSPATYAASALRQALLGPVTPRLAVDAAVLLALGLVIFWVVARRLNWRVDQL